MWLTWICIGNWLSRQPVIWVEVVVLYHKLIRLRPCAHGFVCSLRSIFKVQPVPKSALTFTLYSALLALPKQMCSWMWPSYNFLISRIFPWNLCFTICSIRLVELWVFSFFFPCKFFYFYWQICLCGVLLSAQNHVCSFYQKICWVLWLAPYIINVLPLHSKFILYCVTCKNRYGPFKSFPLLFGMMFKHCQ